MTLKRQYVSLTRWAQQLDMYRKILATVAMDEVNNRYGNFTVTYGSVLGNEEKRSLVIFPAWRQVSMLGIGFRLWPGMGADIASHRRDYC